MKFILLLVLPFLVACGSMPLATGTGGSQQGFASFGTLSDSGNIIEQKASAVYTDLSRFGYLAAQLLNQKKITVERAKEAVANYNQIREMLDDAVKNRSLVRIKIAQRNIKKELARLEAGL